MPQRVHNNPPLVQRQSTENTLKEYMECNDVIVQINKTSLRNLEVWLGHIFSSLNARFDETLPTVTFRRDIQVETSTRNQEVEKGEASTSNAKQQVDNNPTFVKQNDLHVTFDVFKTLKFANELEECHAIELLESNLDENLELNYQGMKVDATKHEYWDLANGTFKELEEPIEIKESMSHHHIRTNPT
ncbi:hypothetical protein GQ457_07G012190 [Hibiscus cannabinus]